MPHPQSPPPDLIRGSFAARAVLRVTRGSSPRETSVGADRDIAPQPYKNITANIATTAGTVWMNRILRLAVTAP